MYTLLLDGSGPKLGLATCQTSQPLYLQRIPFESYETLTDYLSQSLATQQIEIEQIGALGVITGPGGYTGLRSSLLLVRTWAQTRQVPVWGCTHWELAFFEMRDSPEEVLFVQPIKHTHFLITRGRHEKNQVVYSLRPELILKADLSLHLATPYVRLVSPFPETLEGAFTLRDSLLIMADWCPVQPPTAWQQLVPFYAKPATLTPPKAKEAMPKKAGLNPQRLFQHRSKHDEDAGLPRAGD
ncbi:MAG: hypothetical protein ACO1RX_15535 [Candidatus Sericytochromatia bacterium]